MASGIEGLTSCRSPRVFPAKFEKNGVLHLMNRSFATHLLEASGDTSTVRELPAHSDDCTTMVYLHVKNRPALAQKSPIDGVLAQGK